MSDVLIRMSPEEYKVQLRAVRTLAAVREWTEVNVEHRIYGAHYIKAAEDVLAILDRSDTDE